MGFFFFSFFFFLWWLFSPNPATDVSRTSHPILDKIQKRVWQVKIFPKLTVYSHLSRSCKSFSHAFVSRLSAENSGPHVATLLTVLPLNTTSSLLLFWHARSSHASRQKKRCNRTSAVETQGSNYGPLGTILLPCFSLFFN